MLQPPVIVVPGITATQLDDYYPLETEVVWSAILNKQWERIALHPDDQRYEAIEPARVRPRNPFGLVYGDLVEALRHDLSRKADQATPVYGFGYDWRRDCRLTADELESFIEEVLARTSLIRHYQKALPTEVDLVGHSMGGLVVARYLKKRQDANLPSRVRRVITLGTPFRGAVDAILKVTTGMGTLTGADPRDRERETARTIPALYQLLPSYRAATNGGVADNSDVFEVRNWQPSILATLKEFIRLRGARVHETALLVAMLKLSRDFIEDVNKLDPDRALSEGKDAWLPIVGIDEKTQVRFSIKTQPNGQPRFQFPDMDNDGELTGDGTVPFPGACPDFFPRERLVCVAKKDLSIWEIRDRALVEAATLHAFLPKVNLVQKMVIRFLRKDFGGGKYAARPAPGVVKPQWQQWRWLSQKEH